MPDAGELIALAERCEAARGADRELDCRISLLLGGQSWSDAEIAELLRYRDEPTGYGRYCPADEYVVTYTASLNAAMALVPEGCDWAAGTAGQAKGGHAFLDPNTGTADCIDVNAATPALALCAAALRARASQSGDA